MKFLPLLFYCKSFCKIVKCVAFIWFFKSICFPLISFTHFLGDLCAVLSCSVMFHSLWPHEPLPARFLCPWGFSRQYWSGLSCRPLGDLPKPETEPGLPHHGWILYHLSHQGSPRILEWVTWPFSRGSSWPRNCTGVSCIVDRFFTTREAYPHQTLPKFLPQLFALQVPYVISLICFPHF